jgi:hypothetical protein
VRDEVDREIISFDSVQESAPKRAAM